VREGIEERIRHVLVEESRPNCIVEAVGNGLLAFDWNENILCGVKLELFTSW
jgi:hypothetical protein